MARPIDKKTLKLTYDELEDLSTLLDPEFIKDMKMARQSIMEGKLTEWKPGTAGK